MNDENRTKDELILEIRQLREELERMQSEVGAIKNRSKHELSEIKKRGPREELNAQIELAAEVDVINGEGINISEGGVSFAIEEELVFDIMFESNGEVYRGNADLAWFKRLKDGGCHLGFEYHRDAHPTEK